MVVGYPQLFAPPQSWGLWRGGTCYFLNAQDAALLNDAALQLDDALRSAVQQAQTMTQQRIDYLSLVSVYDQDGTDHSLCSGNTEWLNGPTLNFDDSFHPNELGNLATA